MPERRGSSMYDAIRDVFTSSDAVPQESNEEAVEDASPEPPGDTNDVDQAPSAAISPPATNKRKRSSSPVPQKSPPREPSEALNKHSALHSTSKNEPGSEKSKSSPASEQHADRAPKAMTAANLASIPRAKKSSNQDARGSQNENAKSRTSRRRSRSPEKESVYSRRRDRSPPHRKRTPTPEPIPRSPTPPPRSPPRQRRRPGATARVSAADTEAVRQRQAKREEENNSIAQAEAVARGVHDVVRQHYNAVPQRGKDWRKTDSKIKGLRSLNNWIKSAVIQKFSPSEDYTPGSHENGYNGDAPNGQGLLVLDMGCGKGGDLQKWHAAPEKVDLYVGLDPAEISIEQARERYSSMRRSGGRGFRDRRRLFQAELSVKDCYGQWIGDIPIVQEVGIDSSVGPDGQGPKRYGGGGFDVVTMMFCMHYAFENEAKARMMLRNVAGALKKGGRFIGVIPDSNALIAKIAEHHKRRGTKPAAAADADDSDDDWDPERTLDAQAQSADPKPASPAPAKEQNGTGAGPQPAQDDTDDDTLTWGNSIYSVKFPHASRAPADGVFRPVFGWKYFYFLEEAVEEIPEYVVPWEGFRALALEYDLELQYRRPFREVLDAERDDPILGPLSERMGVAERGTGRLLASDEDIEASAFYVAFCFYKVGV